MEDTLTPIYIRCASVLNFHNCFIDYSEFKTAEFATLQTAVECNFYECYGEIFGYNRTIKDTIVTRTADGWVRGMCVEYNILDNVTFLDKGTLDIAGSGGIGASEDNRPKLIVNNIKLLGSETYVPTADKGKGNVIYCFDIPTKPILHTLGTVQSVIETPSVTFCNGFTNIIPGCMALGASDKPL